eukprot:Gregarina_sp_Poly_1__4536@NODE_2435_length_2141_cov_265_445034_g257_i2_p2_GENE_NODE_2435_length_2141_cov_265_445034_g257_i2NODE_2435_length_2141_cov_265_445034_g257_i2_p2_ORF_typecomplete_len189_score15_32zfCCCH/PF00642_24/0_0028zfCCCH/PF00642_24/2_2zfCCCH/PF00642_24/0_00049zfCCCH_3/PF15663_5/8_7e05zfCCCH_3/PF15663_5/0_34Torus/PF16131_5/0_00098Torus/PF16131_5/9_1e02Torus/PF16131_5/0_58zfCCCH_4/PF18044_1/2_3zfCCCH_4/PF18044_1/2_7e03zfCCCH_4/PF18044_1/1_2e03zfCCCH_4/PF18044_1/0_017zf_CCCH_4/PF1834
MLGRHLGLPSGHSANLRPQGRLPPPPHRRYSSGPDSGGGPPAAFAPRPDTVFRPVPFVDIGGIPPTPASKRQRRSTSCSVPANVAAASSRSPQFYKTRMCPWFFKQCCDLGVKCRFAHSVEELRRPPDLSRTSLCPRLMKQGVCTTFNCSYAHSHLELRATNDFFKVSLCYMWQKGRCTLGSRCRHAV